VDLYLTAPVLPFHPAVGASFATFTARQDVSPQPLPVIRAGQLHVGSKLFCKAAGEFSTTVTPSLTLGFYIGTAAGAITIPLVESSAIVTASGAANLSWAMEWVGTVVGLGAAGSIVGHGTIDFGLTLTTLSATPMPITQALRTVAIDTTIDRAVGVCATWTASSASNIVKTNSHMAVLFN
jgi:hypothetical protein